MARTEISLPGCDDVLFLGFSEYELSVTGTVHSEEFGWDLFNEIDDAGKCCRSDMIHAEHAIVFVGREAIDEGQDLAWNNSWHCHTSLDLGMELRVSRSIAYFWGTSGVQ